MTIGSFPRIKTRAARPNPAKLLFILATAILAGFLSAKGAYPVEVPLASDTHTTTLWQLFETGKGEVSDSSGSGHTGILSPGVAITNQPHTLPRLKRAADFSGTEADTLPHILNADAGTPLLTGPFTVEMRLRFDNSGGYWLRAGTNPDLRWGMLLRGAGYMHINGTTRSSDGGTTAFTLMNQTFLEAVGPIDFERFYLYALTFDGERTFRVYVDGVLAWEASLPSDQNGLVLSDSRLAIGRPIQWKSPFSGHIAEVRVSDIEREILPMSRNHPESLAAAAPNYRFDMGTLDSPVAEGFISVTPDTPYTPEIGYGWVAEPVDSWDYWFAPGRYRPQPERSAALFEHGVLDWSLRDGLTFPSGPAFRADLPPGTYAVRVTLGHPRERTRTEAIIVNDQPIGEHLRFLKPGGEPETIRTDAKDTSAQDTITARGIVRVGEDGLRLEVRGPDDEPVHVLNVEASPWAPPVIGHGPDGTLVWNGSGAAPAGFAEAAAAFARRNFRQAAKEAAAIRDPLTRATVLAWILGYPNSTSGWHVELADEIIRTLRDYLAVEPQDVQAQSLLEATLTFYPTLRVQTDQGIGTNGLFGSNNWRWMRDAAMLALQITPEEPYYGRARLLAGALIYQRVEQAGGLSGPFLYQRPAYHKATPFPTTYFRDAAEEWPEATLARIYAGQKVPLEKDIPIPEGTPEWAALQHRALVRVMDTIHYWTDERQDEQGYLGGGLGDDVETLRWWSIGDLVTDDERTREGWRHLAETAWNSTGGVGHWSASRISDVEHGTEPIGDTLTYLPFIEFGTERFEEVLDRQRVVLDNILNVWTAENPDGFRMFRSTHFSATEVQEGRGGDHFYGVRAANPALFLTWFTGDERGRKFIIDWAESWHEAILAERDGKPAGIWPIIVTFNDRSFTMDGKPWYDPGYYWFPPGQRIYNVLLAAYELTGNDRFLEPQRATLELLREHAPSAEDVLREEEQAGSQFRGVLAKDAETHLEKGSAAWAVWFGRDYFGEVGARYRIVTGDTSFDDILARFAPPVTRFQIAYEQADTVAGKQAALSPITVQLEDALNHLDYNWPLRTSEPKSTDRVWVHGTETLISMATGTSSLDGIRGAERQWPIFGVSWKNTGTDVSILVTDNSRDRLAGYLYSFDDKPREIGARIWRLKAGNYRLRTGVVEDFGEEPVEWTENRTLSISRRGQIVPLTLPPGKQVRFELLQ